jgi:hypothetical protein
MIIVFAHFYTQLPKHLILNIKRTITLFPEHEIYLVTDLDINKYLIKKLKVFKYHPDSNWFKLERILTHDKEFRGNFWFTSIARFIAISEFAKIYDGEILHLESDVIISSDFPFKLLSKTKALFLFPIISDSQAIASCLYIRNSAAAKYLAKLVISESLNNSETTDMFVLHKLARIQGKDFELLPASPSQKNAMPSANDNFLKDNEKMVTYFGGVFDGFDIGRYLFGMDPRNKRGFSTLRAFDPAVYLNVRELDLQVNSSRDFPYVLDINTNKMIPIFALHIHSKNRKLFIPTKFNKFIRKAVNESKYPPKRKFYLKTFFNSIRFAIHRRLNVLMREYLIPFMNRFK